MILSTAIVAIFLCICRYCSCLRASVDKVAGVNISVVAKSIPGTGLSVFVIGGAWFALLTTLNGTLSWTTRLLQRAAMDALGFRKSAQRKIKNGTPVLLLFFFFIVGLIPILTGMDTTDYQYGYRLQQTDRPVLRSVHAGDFLSLFPGGL